MLFFVFSLFFCKRNKLILFPGLVRLALSHPFGPDFTFERDMAAFVIAA
jgi:hypothetical protein